MAKALKIGEVNVYPYTKEGDKEGFQRFRILDKIVMNDKIFQLNGFITEIKKVVK